PDPRRAPAAVPARDGGGDRGGWPGRDLRPRGGAEGSREVDRRGCRMVAGLVGRLRLRDPLALGPARCRAHPRSRPRSLPADLRGDRAAGDHRRDRREAGIRMTIALASHPVMAADIFDGFSLLEADAGTGKTWT